MRVGGRAVVEIMVTIKDIEKRIEHYQRLEMAGVEFPEIALGPIDILWIKPREGEESWILLPRWLGKLVMSDLYNDENVAKAKLCQSALADAPLDIVWQWVLARAKK